MNNNYVEIQSFELIDVHDNNYEIEIYITQDYNILDIEYHEGYIRVYTVQQNNLPKTRKQKILFLYPGFDVPGIYYHNYICSLRIAAYILKHSAFKVNT